MFSSQFVLELAKCIAAVKMCRVYSQKTTFLCLLRRFAFSLSTKATKCLAGACFPLYIVNEFVRFLAICSLIHEHLQSQMLLLYLIMSRHMHYYFLGSLRVRPSGMYMMFFLFPAVLPLIFNRMLLHVSL